MLIFEIAFSVTYSCHCSGELGIASLFARAGRRDQGLSEGEFVANNPILKPNTDGIYSG